MGKLAKYLEKMFFGSVGGTETIMNAVMKGPTDAVVIAQLSKAGRQPLRYIANIDMVIPVVVNSITLNDLGGTLVWTRGGTGVYVGTLAGAFAGLVIPRIMPRENTGVLGTISWAKTSSNTVQVNIIDEGGSGVDAFGIDVCIEVIQPIT